MASNSCANLQGGVELQVNLQTSKLTTNNWGCNGDGCRSRGHNIGESSNPW